MLRQLGLTALCTSVVGMLLGVVTFNVVPAAESTKPKKQSPQELAAQIDQFLAESWRGNDVVPAEMASDAEFFRRVSLDLIGRIPSVAEVREFLADTHADKRQRVVEAKLAEPAWAQHFSHAWRTLLLSQANPQDVRYLAPRVETWLQRQLRDEVPYDVWVRKLITAQLDVRPVGTLASQDNIEGHAIVFFQANELKPENLAAATARMFLGINLDCAQCHNHPFADWKQDQFWQLAAFYSGVQRLRPDNSFMAAPEATDRHELTIPGTKRIVQATFLDGQSFLRSKSTSPRTELAQWVTSRDNPYFARAVANRLWAQFFGRGIVEPLEDLGGRGSPTHPALLDELARQLIAHDFDIKFLVRAITSSQAYQRTSRSNHPSQLEPKHFARMSVRGMTAEQVWDSLALATGYRDPANSPSTKAEFLAKFADLDRPTETQTSIVQALSLMNGRFTLSATTLSSSETLAAVADAPFLSLDGRIETLFLATVSRRPTVEEVESLTKFYHKQGETPEAWGDIFWALLNSSEFILNH